jgi:WD40 repeat protein
MSLLTDSRLSRVTWSVLLVVWLHISASAQTGAGTPVPKLRDPVVARSAGPLPNGAVARFGVQAFRHSDSISAVVFTPDGSRIATLGRDHAVCVWERSTGRLVYRIFDARIDFQHLAFSRDGKRLVVTGNKEGDGNILQIHDAETGERLHQMHGHEQPVYAIWFLPNETHFLSASCDQTIRWDLTAGKAVDERVQSWPTGIMGVAADRPILAFASNRKEDPLVRLLDVVTGKPLLTIEGEIKEVTDPDQADRTQTMIVRPEQAIVALALSPDGKLLASGSPFEHIRLWDVATGQLVRTLDDPQGGIALCFSPDSKRLATGNINGLVRIWDAGTGREVRNYPGFKAWVNALAFAPDGKTLAMAGAESRTLYLWDVDSGKDQRPGPGHRGAVEALGFTANGRFLISAGCGRDDDNQSICIWERDTGRLLHHFGKFDARVLAFAFSGDGRKLAVAQEHQSLPQVFEIPSGKSFDKFQTPVPSSKSDAHGTELRFLALCFSADGRQLAGASADGKLYIWDNATGKCHHCWQAHPCTITSLAFTPDGNKLLSTAEDHTTRLWDVKTGQELLQLTQGEVDSLNCLRISPDGNLAAAIGAANDGTVYLWDLESGKELRRLATRRIKQLAFAPNSKVLATSDLDGNMSIHEIATGKLRASFAGHLGEVTAMSFAPDGLTLATGSADTTLLLWDATGGNLIRAAWAPMPEAQLLKLWHDLMDDDAIVAYRAMWKLAACPDQAESFLQERLKPAPRPSAEKIRQLIRDLDDASFAHRTLATNALLTLGEQAAPYLEDVLEQSPSSEVAQRVKALLSRLEMAELSKEQVRRERALETLGWIGTTNISPGLHAQGKK